MRLIVQKYGGTSVGDAARICNVARRLLETQREGCRVVAVISAMAGVTDNLIKLARDVSPQPTPRELDLLLATGEHAATALIAMAVNAYLIIDGRPGPSTSKQDAIDILSFSFGASQTAVIGVGSSGGESRSGRANLCARRWRDHGTGEASGRRETDRGRQAGRRRPCRHVCGRQARSGRAHGTSSRSAAASVT